VQVTIVRIDVPTRNAKIIGSIVPQTSRLRILLVDDHGLVREALRALLETESEIEIVGEAATCAEALDAVDRLKPTVAVIDIGLPDRSGIELAAELKARKSTTRVLMFTAHATKEHVRAALRAGALGYVLKDTSFADLMRGLRAVSIGQMFLQVCEPYKAPNLLRAAMEGAAEVSGHSGITSREREVLAGVALGFSNKEMARSLHVSIKTVDKHRGNLMRKLDLHSVADVTRYAIREGLMDAMGIFVSNPSTSIGATILN
jgi:DNA-binding NarL/FixJ family response regulator